MSVLMRALVARVGPDGHTFARKRKRKLGVDL
jgi:hypothetical protein